MPTFQDSKIVPYRAEQLFDIVADVGAYPQFLPWCLGATVHHQDEAMLLADLKVGFGPVGESFRSRVTLERARRIRATYEDGPFYFLNNQWLFVPHADGTRVSFWVDFEFKSRILQALMGGMFNEAVRRMVSAFTDRAAQLAAAPALPPIGSLQNHATSGSSS